MCGLRSEADKVKSLFDVRFASKSGTFARTKRIPLRAESGPLAVQQKGSLFDHIGGGEQRRWNCEAERLGGPEASRP
jgi:hypothetical protein